MISLLKDKQVLSIDLSYAEDGEVHFHYLLAAIKNGQLSVVAYGVKIPIAEIDLALKAFKDLPILLNISGSPVFQKNVEGLSSTIETADDVIPGASDDEFLLQVQSSPQGSHAALIRSEALKHALSYFSSYFIIDLSLGAILAALIPVVNSELNSTQIGDYKLQVDIFEYSPAQDEKLINFSGEKVPEACLLAFAHCIRWASNQAFTIDKLNITIAAQIQNYTEKKKYKLFLSAGLVVLFIALLLNFLLFTHYSKSNEDLSAVVGPVANSSGVGDSLEKEISIKTKFLQDNGWLQSSRVSYYSDRIGSTVDPAITLEDMQVYPLVFEADSMVGYANSKIVLKGVCPNAYNLNNWKNLLQTFDWVQKAELLSYTYMKEDNKAKFELCLYLQ
jgi:hypothetical protein